MIVRQTLLGTGRFASHFIVSGGHVLRPLVGMVIVMQMFGDRRRQSRVTGQMRRTRHIGHEQRADQYAESENSGDHMSVIASPRSWGNWRCLP